MLADTAAARCCTSSIPEDLTIPSFRGISVNVHEVPETGQLVKGGGRESFLAKQRQWANDFFKRGGKKLCAVSERGRGRKRVSCRDGVKMEALPCGQSVVHQNKLLRRKVGVLQLFKR